MTYPPGYPPVVCFDMDSTLRNSRQRWHLSPKEDPSSDWHIYSAAGLADDPIPGTVRLLRMLWNAGYEIHIVSGSMESAREQTTEWLSRHVGLKHIAKIALRADGDERDAGAYKVDYVRELMQERQVDLFAEDWVPAAADIERETGVPVLVVNPGYPCQSCGVEQVETAKAGQTDNIGGGL